MQILSPKFPGLFFICDQCGAMIGNVQQNEIYEENAVYCPICHWKNTLNYKKSYDGIVKIAAEAPVVQPNDEAAPREETKNATDNSTN